MYYIVQWDTSVGLAQSLVDNTFLKDMTLEFSILVNSRIQLDTMDKS